MDELSSTISAQTTELLAINTSFAASQAAFSEAAIANVVELKEQVAVRLNEHEAHTKAVAATVTQEIESKAQEMEKVTNYRKHKHPPHVSVTYKSVRIC